MKRSSFFAIVMVLIFSGCAQSVLRTPSSERAPGMTQMDRHPFDEASFQKTHGEAFRVQVSCELKCQNQNFVYAQGPSAIFDPKSEYADEEANGNLVPHLSFRLQLLGDQSCLTLASSTCGSAEKIERVEAKKLVSGSWEAALPLDCKKSRGYVLSPYDVQFKNSLDLVSTAHAPSWSDDPDRAFRGPRNAQLSPSYPSCVHPIRAHVCYGDCMSNDAQARAKSSADWPETLMTPTYEGEDNVSVCGDELFLKFSTNPAPQAVRVLACRKFFYEKMAQQESDATSCSAYRADLPDCLLW
jgi:hypothetical protein